MRRPGLNDLRLDAYGSLAGLAEKITRKVTDVAESLQFHIDWEAMARS